jgi:hypothetical protein
MDSLALITTTATDSRSSIFFDRAYFSAISHGASAGNVAVDFGKQMILSFVFGANPVGSSTPRAAEFNFNFAKSRVTGAPGPLQERGFGFKILGNNITPQVHNGTTLTELAASSAYLFTSTDRNNVLLAAYNRGGGVVEFFANGQSIGTTTAGPTGSHNLNLPSIHACLEEKSAAVGTSVSIANIHFVKQP